MTLSRGRFGGVPLSQVEESYLMLLSAQKLRPELADAVEKEMERRVLARRELKRAA